MTARSPKTVMPDYKFFPLWKRQFTHQLQQMHDQANLLGYPKYDDFTDFCIHVYTTCPQLINESLN